MKAVTHASAGYIEWGVIPTRHDLHWEVWTYGKGKEREHGGAILFGDIPLFLG